MVTVEAVAEYIGATSEELLLPVLLSQAESLIDSYLGPRGRSRIPQPERDGAVLQLVSELWSRRNAPAGNLQWSPEGGAVYMASDPLQSVKPLIRRYKDLGAVG